MMDYLIGGVGILMLLFLAYCAIAIPYYYIKKIYFKTKGLKKSAVNLSVKLQKDNTRRTLERLLNAMIEGEEYMKSSGGKMLLKDQQKVTKIQKQLLLDMIGPATKAELKRELFDPIINNKSNSKLIKDGLKHVLKHYKIKD
tara:strand:- start:252 stop:677 length:426 start_codon:yes stop_codon:yes gene_type:complete